jgi:uncharacterized protein YidB (DUF937 family)
MDGSLKRKVVAGAAAALAVGGAGAGIAATKLSHSPREESQAVVNDAAKQLGVEPSKLSAALKKALEDRVDAAVADGTITKAEGEALKQRIESDGLPLLVPPLGFRHFGFHDHGPPGLPAAAKYLGLSESQLESKLESGKTLAQVARDEGKSVDGLVSALKDDLKAKLDQAVADGRLTKTQEAQLLADAQQRLTDLVNGAFPAGPPEGRGWFRHGPGFSFRGSFDRSPPADGNLGL